MQNSTALFLFSPQGSLIYVSDAPDGLVQKVLKAVRRFVECGEDPMEVERLEDGTLEIETIKKDGFTGILALYSQQTSEKDHWRIVELKKLAMELEAVFATSGDGLVVADGQGVYLNVNPSYERISGLSRDEIVGSTGHDIMVQGLVSQSATELVLASGKPASINQVFRTGRRSYITATPLYNENGQIFRVVTNVRDTTELHALRDKLSKSEARLNRYSQIVKTLTREKDRLVFRSPKMREVHDNALRFAQVDAPLLLVGDTGVGKEVVADFVHNHSPRAQEPFLKINCAAIPEHLLEAELFGYEEGSFTGSAKGGKTGLLEMAHNGSVLLDEVGEMPLLLQAKLLRFAESQEFYRVGGKKPRKINVRLLAATNRDLEEMVANRTFRMDLLYRLNMLRITIPPLSERSEDILILAQHFLEKANQRYGHAKAFDPNIYKFFMGYSWPGNVRELSHLVERLVIMSDGPVIEPELLPRNMLFEHLDKPAHTADAPLSYREARDSFERSFWGRVQILYPSYRQAAKELDVNHATVMKKINRYGNIETGMGGGKK